MLLSSIIHNKQVVIDNYHIAIFSNQNATKSNKFQKHPKRATLSDITWPQITDLKFKNIQPFEILTQMALEQIEIDTFNTLENGPQRKST